MYILPIYIQQTQRLLLISAQISKIFLETPLYLTLSTLNRSKDFYSNIYNFHGGFDPRLPHISFLSTYHDISTHFSTDIKKFTERALPQTRPPLPFNIQVQKTMGFSTNFSTNIENFLGGFAP